MIWNSENTSRESARQVFQILKELGESVVRLQEQQKVDFKTSAQFQQQLTDLQQTLKTVEVGYAGIYKDLKQLLERVHRLEDDFLTKQEFNEYLAELERIRLQEKECEIEQKNTGWRRAGFLFSGMAIAFLSPEVLPKIRDVIIWIARHVHF